MGIHLYVCAWCKKSIRQGESAVLFHLRHGEILGKDLGWYDGYGRVSNRGDFNRNNDTINSNDEIWTSSNMLEDSGEKSGICAGHVNCYKKFIKKKSSNLKYLPISKIDDKQDGKPRDKYSDITEYVEFMKEWK